MDVRDLEFAASTTTLYSTIRTKWIAFVHCLVLGLNMQLAPVVLLCWPVLSVSWYTICKIVHEDILNQQSEVTCNSAVRASSI